MKKNGKILIFAIFVALVIIAIFVVQKIYTAPKIPYLKINNTGIDLEIADTLEKQITGLSYRESLDQKSGMLFVFPVKEMKSFWMKDMKFSLDIIWIDEDRIIKIDKSLPIAGPNPDKRYYSSEPVNYVLEVNGGFADLHNIKVGDRVNYFLK